MRIETDGVGLDVTIEGEGPPVLLLHGWPDTHELWEHQTKALVAAGYQVIAPDLRGFGASDKPEGVDAYNILSLAGDVLGVLDHLGLERAHVVGHDWGAALAWAIAAFMPDRVDHLACLSVGHPAVVRRRRDGAAPAQLVHAPVPVRGHRRAVAVDGRLRRTCGSGATTRSSSRSSPASASRAP